MTTTTYAEWRVTGTPRHKPICIMFSGADLAQPEAAARAYMENVTTAISASWVDGPHLHTRTVTATVWETA